MVGLTEREGIILNALIERHVDTAEPVSSHELSEHFGFRWSSATVRNVLSGLEEKGFVNHPHTSAGKVPTVKAYKYMVEKIIQSQTGLNGDDQHKIFDILGEVRETDKLIRMTAKVLAIASRLLAVTWLPSRSEERLERVQVIRLSSHKAMLVVRTLARNEYQHVVDLEEIVTPPLVEKVIWLVNHRGRGMTAEELGRLVSADWSGLDRRMVFLVKQALSWIRTSLQSPQMDTVVIEGAANLIGQPEFNDIQATRELVSILDQRGQLVQSLKNPGIRYQGVRVVIGEAGWAKNFPILSLVLEEIPLPDQRSMQIAVIGPSRMAYERIIPLVQEAAMALSHAIA